MKRGKSLKRVGKTIAGTTIKIESKQPTKKNYKEISKMATKIALINVL